MVMSMVERKAFAFSWIINGLIIGLLVLVIFASILSKIYIEQARQSATKEFNEVYSRVNALCSANVDEEMFYALNIPDIVELMYVSQDKKTLPSDIEAKKKGYDVAVASNLCMQLREEELKCRSLKCRTQMSYIGQKKTVMSFAESILSQPKYVEYSLFFEKMDCGVAVLKDGKCTPAGCETSLTGTC